MPETDIEREARDEPYINGHETQLAPEVDEDDDMLAADEDADDEDLDELDDDDDEDEDAELAQAEPDKHTEKQLDHGLKETFPASDPVSINPGAD